MRDAHFRILRFELESGTRYVGLAWNYDAAVLLGTGDRPSYTAARLSLDAMASDHGVQLKWFDGEYIVRDGTLQRVESGYLSIHDLPRVTS